MNYTYLELVYIKRERERKQWLRESPTLNSVITSRSRVCQAQVTVWLFYGGGGGQQQQTLNEQREQALDRQTPRQQAKHEKLYPNPFLAEKDRPFNLCRLSAWSVIVCSRWHCAGLTGCVYVCVSVGHCSPLENSARSAGVCVCVSLLPCTTSRRVRCFCRLQFIDGESATCCAAAHEHNKKQNTYRGGSVARSDGEALDVQPNALGLTLNNSLKITNFSVPAIRFFSFNRNGFLLNRNGTEPHHANWN